VQSQTVTSTRNQDSCTCLAKTIHSLFSDGPPSNSGWGGKGGGKDEQGRQRATGAGNPGWFGWERAVGSAEGDL